jgi:hypothetical protein
MTKKSKSLLSENLNIRYTRICQHLHAFKKFKVLQFTRNLPRRFLHHQKGDPSSDYKICKNRSFLIHIPIRVTDGCRLRWDFELDGRVSRGTKRSQQLEADRNLKGIGKLQLDEWDLWQEGSGITRMQGWLWSVKHFGSLFGSIRMLKWKMNWIFAMICDIWWSGLFVKLFCWINALQNTKIILFQNRSQSSMGLDALPFLSQQTTITEDIWFEWDWGQYFTRIKAFQTKKVTMTVTLSHNELKWCLWCQSSPSGIWFEWEGQQYSNEWSPTRCKIANRRWENSFAIV